MKIISPTGRISSTDPVAISKHIANVLSEIIFDKSIDSNTWWKKDGENNAE